MSSMDIENKKGSDSRSSSRSPSPVFSVFQASLEMGAPVPISPGKRSKACLFAGDGYDYKKSPIRLQQSNDSDEPGSAAPSRLASLKPATANPVRFAHRRRDKSVSSLDYSTDSNSRADSFYSRDGSVVWTNRFAAVHEDGYFSRPSSSGSDDEHGFFSDDECTAYTEDERISIPGEFAVERSTKNVQADQKQELDDQYHQRVPSAPTPSALEPKGAPPRLPTFETMEPPLWPKLWSVGTGGPLAPDVPSHQYIVEPQPALEEGTFLCKIHSTSDIDKKLIAALPPELHAVVCCGCMRALVVRKTTVVAKCPGCNTISPATSFSIRKAVGSAAHTDSKTAPHSGTTRIWRRNV